MNDPVEGEPVAMLSVDECANGAARPTSSCGFGTGVDDPPMGRLRGKYALHMLVASTQELAQAGTRDEFCTDEASLVSSS